MACSGGMRGVTHIKLSDYHLIGSGYRDKRTWSGFAFHIEMGIVIGDHYLFGCTIEMKREKIQCGSIWRQK